MQQEHDFRCVRRIAKRDYFLRHVCLSVRVERLYSNFRIFVKLIFEYFSKICQENISFIKVGQE